MKIELLLNLESFMNIKFPSNGDGDRLDQYEEILPYVEDWIGYNGAPHALKLANHLRKLLGLDPYEVENEVHEQQFTKETIVMDTTINIEHKGRFYKKFTLCRYKCGGLTSWATDYKEGDQKLHIHPTDYEILGFATEDISGKFKCPTVVKKN